MSREQLLAMARTGLAHLEAGTQQLEADQYRVRTTDYTDPQRWQDEVALIFRRLPLMVAFTVELAAPGSYRAMTVMDVPVLLTRGTDGRVRAFVNMCSHRGAVVVEEGAGTARRFACPYHAWTYDTDGALVGVLDADDFGSVERDCLGLTPLPAAERAGMIWISVTPGTTMDLDRHLCGYGELLEHLGLAQCHLVGRQEIAGPNWKVAYDGYLDYYHLPILHRASFGPDMGSTSIYTAWGPHQRLTSPGRHHAHLVGRPEDTWENAELNGGVWTIFPHVSIAAFDAGGKIFMVSQLFPGRSVDESVTVQNFLHTRPADDAQPALVAERMAFNRMVVAEEDYATGLGIQRAIRTGAKQEFVFGRNEGGGHRFHRWVEALLAAGTDDALARTYEAGIDLHA
jgi:phenylpropionate dioxygenase-like ring-hydroxylating dioxygenase large terminal subunit